LLYKNKAAEDVISAANCLSLLTCYHISSIVVI